MKVFDFDNTLYHGESSIEFGFFLMKKNIKVALWIPKMLFGLLRYKMCLISREEIMNQTDDFMKIIISSKKEVEDMAFEFWEKNEKYLHKELIEKIEADDIIITASPSFIIEPLKNKLRTSNIISSEIDLANKHVVNLIFGEHKVKAYREKYGETPIDCFYTDSYNDKSLMDISKTVFLVDKKSIKQIK